MVRKYLNILTVQMGQRTLTPPPTYYSLMNVMCKIEIELNSLKLENCWLSKFQTNFIYILYFAMLTTKMLKTCLIINQMRLSKKLITYC